MYIVGKTSPENERLVRVAKECLDIGAAAARPWGFVQDIGRAIGEHAHKNGYSVVRDLCGHGVGLKFHDDPDVDHYDTGEQGMLLVPGMVFTIEPGIYDPELGGIRLENDYLITDTGYEKLTNSRIIRL